MKRQIGYILTAFIVLNGYTQSTFKAKSESGEVLIGATARVVTMDALREEQLIADTSGIFNTTFATPFIAHIRHQGFEPIEVRIDRSGQQVPLKPSVSFLEDVVVTGQYAPQSARNSVYNVRSIGQARIVAQGANNLQDVLANELNIRFTRDNATGRSGLSMQGLSGQYVKVLLDGIPMTGRGGVSNDIDLNQIDIQNVERIELVEGPMAVNYGADALAGVVNIITKKDIAAKVNVNVVLQEETIGDEYTLFDEGIHSPSLSLGYTLNEQWYVQANGRYFRYGGWQGNSEGREKDWYPKDQYFGGFLTRFEKGNVAIYYRLDYLDETLQNLGAVNDNNELLDPFAIDEAYLTQRWMHQLQGDVKLGSNRSVNAVFSYTDFNRYTSQFSTNLVTGREQTTTPNEQDTLFYESFFTRQTVNNVLSGRWGSLQIGLDGTREMAGGTTLNAGDKSLTDLGFFSSAEFIWGRLKVRPGLRLTYNSIFNTTPTSSVNFSYQLNNQTQLRWSYGRGFRAPSLRELYHEFIDANHNIIGNASLEPEYSHSFNADVSHRLKQAPIELKASVFYNTIDNLITFFTPEGSANQATTYRNVLEFKTTGFNVGASYEKGHLRVRSGFSYIGQFQRLSEEADVPAFVFSPEVNTQLNYHSIAKTGINGALFYKYTGPNEDYLLDENDEAQLRGIPGFHTLDITLSKAIQSFGLSIGCRNLTDVTFLNNTSRGGVHGGGPQSPVGNGRSYFLRINYQFQQ